MGVQPHRRPALHGYGSELAVQRRLRALSIVALALAAPLVAVAVPTPAYAATDLLISTDGVTFGPALTSGLFDGLGMMVPLDTETATFWVKNPTADPASLRVSVQDLVVTSAVLASSMTLTAFDDGTGTTNNSQLDTLAPCDVVIAPQTILSGAVIRVDLTITMLNVNGLTAQDKIGALTFLAAMRDLSAGPFPPTACNDDGVIISSNLPSRMAYTGQELPTNWLVAGGAALGFGILLVLRRRRKPDDETLSE